MKEKCMNNKRVITFLAGLLAGHSSWAFQADFASPPQSGPFSAAFSAGYLQGDADEIVYDYETPDGSRRKLSHLFWDLSDVIMGGGEVGYRVNERWSLNAGVWLALSEGSGEMDNYDWLDTSSADWTDYSLSDVSVTDGYVIDLNVTYAFYRRDDANLRLILGYKQNGWSWEDAGVYALYPEYDYVPLDLGGEIGITYEQEFRMPYAGISGELTRGRFGFSGYAVWSPLVSAEDWDHHIERTIYFHGSFEGGDMLGLGIEARYALKDNLFLTASVEQQTIDLIVGDVDLLDYSTGEYYEGEDEVGIENSYTVFSLGLGFAF
jgi:outer membrane protease